MISEKDKYIFFIIAFDASPNKRYLDQINEAIDYGFSLKDLMKAYCDTGKPQFESIYPSSADDMTFSKYVAARVIGESAAENSKYNFISDINSALSIGWTRGEVLYEIFNNILSKSKNNKEWGNVINKIENKYLFSKLLLEENISSNSTDSKLRWLIDGIDEKSDDLYKIKEEKNDRLSIVDNYGYVDVLGNKKQSDAILSGYKWSDFKSTITYNFELDSDYLKKITEPENRNSWRPLRDYEKDSVKNAVENFNKYLGVNLVYKSGSSSDINISASNLYYNSGMAYYPGESDMAGDIWLDTDFEAVDYQVNGYGNHTVLHELGHAMGLRHTHESSLAKTNYDRLFYSVMTYENDKNNLLIDISYHADGSLTSSGKYIYSSALSIFDVQSLQKIYGVNQSTNLEDNTYSIYFEDKDILTIWDSGGLDTIELSLAKGDSNINLTPGTLSSADFRPIEKQIQLHYENLVRLHVDKFSTDYSKKWLFESIVKFFNHYNNDSDKIYTGYGNISIVDGSIIENVVLGLGNDIVKDNFVDNIIKTGDGDDVIYLGSGGHDYVDAGSGFDVVYVDRKKQDVVFLNSGKNDLFLVADNFSAELVGVEKIIYSDTYILI